MNLVKEHLPVQTGYSSQAPFRSLKMECLLSSYVPARYRVAAVFIVALLALGMATTLINWLFTAD